MISLEAILYVFLAIALLFLLGEVLGYYFQPPPKPRETLPFKDYTLAELQKFDGSDSKLPTLLAVDGKVFDVSNSPYYNPGGAYAVFAGHDASLAMAKHSTDPSDLDKPIDDISMSQKDDLQNWVQFYCQKYDEVGRLVGENSDKKK